MQQGSISGFSIVESCNINKLASDNKQLMGFQLIRRQDYCVYPRKLLQNVWFLHCKWCPEMCNSLPLKIYTQVILLLLPYVVQEQLPLILLEPGQKN